jgi:hypothetical protein
LVVDLGEESVEERKSREDIEDELYGERRR